MFSARTLGLCLTALALLSLNPRGARAETYQTCAGFIDALPATINTQGTWCMRKDLGTSLASGAAITIAASNVTIDCNNFKLGGMAAGAGTKTVGIQAINRQNATIRNCAIRGFYRGSELIGSGHAVLDSRFEGNTNFGIYLFGDNMLVRGNRVTNTGGSTGGGIWDRIAVGIYLESSYAATIQDNTVEGVVATEGGNGYAYGIIGSAVMGSIKGNTISTVVADGTGLAMGIRNGYVNSRAVAQDNVVVAGTAPVAGTGMSCAHDGMMMRANVVRGFATTVEACTDIGANVMAP
jgi:hypothetical protein